MLSPWLEVGISCLDFLQDTPSMSHNLLREENKSQQGLSFVSLVWHASLDIHSEATSLSAKVSYFLPRPSGPFCHYWIAVYIKKQISKLRALQEHPGAEEVVFVPPEVARFPLQMIPDLVLWYCVNWALSCSAQMRHKFETLLACSEHFNQGEIRGKAGGMVRKGGEQGFLLL